VSRSKVGRKESEAHVTNGNEDNTNENKLIKDLEKVLKVKGQLGTRGPKQSSQENSSEAHANNPIELVYSLGKSRWGGTSREIT
jgi:hypothetical protein